MRSPCKNGRVRLWATMTVLGSGYDNYGYRVAQALGLQSIDELGGGGSVASYVRTGNSWDRVDNLDTRWSRSTNNGLAFTTR